MIDTLIVDDDFHVASIHGAYVQRVHGFSLAGHAATLESARAQTRRLEPALILLDLYLPDGHGLDLLREARRRDGYRPDFLVITAARDMKSVRQAMQLGAVHYLVKPFTYAQLEQRLLAYRDLRRRLERIQEAEQDEVDALYGLLRGPASPSKSQVGPTMARVSELLTGAGERSAAEIAEQIGISRSTAQRYLSDLVSQGKAELRLQYGTTGRPEHRYRLV